MNKKTIVGLGVLIVIVLAIGIFIWKKSNLGSAIKDGADSKKEVSEKKPIEYNVSFPKDEGSHENASSEWWYLKAHLTNSQDLKNIFSLSLIHYKNGKNGLFLVDAKNRKKYSVEIPGPFSYDASKLNLTNQSNYWTEKDPFNYEMHYDLNNLKINLEMISQKGPLVISKDPQNLLGAYFVQPRLDIKGTLEIAGKKYEVAGLAWIDHQFYTKDSVNLFNSFTSSWKWWAIQLDNGVELMIYDLSSEKNETSGETKSIYIFEKESSGTNFKKISEGYTLEDIDFWEDKESGIKYPTAWVLNIPAENISLNIETITDDQVVAGIKAYEGACRVSGTYREQNVSGWSQFENFFIK